MRLSCLWLKGTSFIRSEAGGDRAHGRKNVGVDETVLKIPGTIQQSAKADDAWCEGKHPNDTRNYTESIPSAAHRGLPCEN